VLCCSERGHLTCAQIHSKRSLAEAVAAAHRVGAQAFFTWQATPVGPLWGATAPVESTVTMVSAPTELVGCTRRRPEGSHSIAVHSYSCQAKLLTDLAFVRKSSLTYHWYVLVSE
jgi:hypothetical protein